MTKPLDGIRVLDLSRLLPGPFCTLILAELGAEVIKVEDTGAGDYLRALPTQNQGLSASFYALNRGKRSIAIDLKQTSGRDLFLKLVETADIVVENFRPGVLNRLHLGYETLRGVRPQLILCSITSYGQTGPLADRAGHDLNYLALSGIFSVLTTATHPTIPGVQIADIVGGTLWPTIRILAALHQKQGVHLDVSMTEGAMSLLLPWFTEPAFGGAIPAPDDSPLAGKNANYQVYSTADKKQMAIAALEPKFWHQLSSVFHQTWTTSDAFAPAPRQAELKSTLSGKFAEKPQETWVNEFSRIDACVEPVLSPDELMTHPQHIARQVFYDLHDPKRGAIPQMRLPIAESPATSPAPRQGEHTDEILTELGLSEETIREFRSQKIIR